MVYKKVQRLAGLTSRVMELLETVEEKSAEEVCSVESSPERAGSPVDGVLVESLLPPRKPQVQGTFDRENFESPILNCRERDDKAFIYNLIRWIGPRVSLP